MKMERRAWKINGFLGVLLGLILAAGAVLVFIAEGSTIGVIGIAAGVVLILLSALVFSGITVVSLMKLKC